ncbi:MAG: transcriptional repressor [Anaerolineales bacterium]|nr:transcriptional repressor [Anaerolineales bacterium]
MPHCQSLIDALRLQGYRITPQREMIIAVIARSHRHLSAEEVFTQVHRQSIAINLATVYRTLDLLVARGLATRLHLGEGQVVYATCQHGPHIHLVCRKCGALIQGDQQLLATVGEQLLALYGFMADLEHISISGVCSDCQAKQNSMEE